MTIVTLISGVLLGAAAVLTVIRLLAGPSLLDRAVALEVLIAIALVGIGVEAAYHRHTSSLPILLGVAIVGFVSSVAVARYAARRRDD